MSGAMQWWKENRARITAEVGRADPVRRIYIKQDDLCAVFKGRLRKCQHPSIYGPGPRQGQCTICHDQVEPIRQPTGV